MINIQKEGLILRFTTGEALQLTPIYMRIRQSLNLQQLLEKQLCDENMLYIKVTWKCEVRQAIYNNSKL